MPRPECPSTANARWTLKPLLIATGIPHAATLLGPRADAVELRHADALPPLAGLDPARPTVVLLGAELLRGPVVAAARQWLARAAPRAAVVACGGAHDAGPPAELPAELLAGYLAAGTPDVAAAVVLGAALRHAGALAAAHRAEQAAAASREALAELTRAGIALGTERDPDALLAAILEQARRLASCDAGSVYLVERAGPGPDAPRVLQFKLSQNRTLPGLPLASFSVPLDHSSVAGHAALTGEALVIADVYALPPGTSYRINRSFDDRFGYRTRSMLVIPMKSQRDEVVGVLQLINSKRTRDALLTTAADVEREVVPFDARALEHVTALAAQAAVSIENTMLHASIERLFDGFVAAAATAVEARDPTTYGHSRRVAQLAVRLAEALDRGLGVGRHRGVRFTRDELLALRYAALLHDFGKVAIREEVLVKEKKLHPAAFERVSGRFAYLVQQAELECERAKAALLGSPSGAAAAGRLGAELAPLEAARDARVAELNAIAAAIAAANEPNASMALLAPVLERAARSEYRDVSGATQPLLTPAELRHLCIARGNLDDDERLEMESHVGHTFRFLQQIPWTPALAAVPAIAHTHHERPNGRGYPHRAAGDAIPLAARIIAVADVFDALTAADRAYKRAVPVARAMEIMRSEAAEGGLDADLLETFFGARLHEAPRAGADAPAESSSRRATPLGRTAIYPSPLARRVVRRG